MSADSASSTRYRRVILKLSGESFVHAGERGIHMDEVVQIAKQAMRASQLGVQVGIVTLKNRTLSPIARLFIEQAHEVAKPLAK